jgi:hypothetical protein
MTSGFQGASVLPVTGAHFPPARINAGGRIQGQDAPSRKENGHDDEPAEFQGGQRAQRARRIQMTEFFETRMGRKFYEADVPALVKAINRMADALESDRAEKPAEPTRPQRTRDRVIQMIASACSKHGCSVTVDYDFANTGSIVIISPDETEADRLRFDFQTSYYKISGVVDGDSVMLQTDDMDGLASLIERIERMAQDWLGE